jgi:hypothetical protein
VKPIESGPEVTADVDPKQLVRSYFEEVLTQRRIDRLEKLLDPSFRSYGPSGASIDREEYRAAVATTWRRSPISLCRSRNRSRSMIS